MLGARSRGVAKLYSNGASLDETFGRQPDMTYNVAIREVAVTPLRQFARRLRSASSLRSFGLFSARYTRCLNASDDVGELGRNVIVYFDQEFNFEAGVQVSAPFASAGEVRSSHS